jgi:hypothetical protein
MTAIYQWFVEEDITTVVTTTLYPAQTEDAVELGISLVYGYMMLIPDEQHNIAVESTSGSITTVLLTTDIEDEEHNIGVESTFGSITEVLITIGPEEEQHNVAVESTFGSITSKLVYAELPDEAMDIGISLISGSMDHI